MHRNLEELVSDAHVILLGRVMEVRSEPHPQYQGLLTVVVTLEVVDVLKGQVPAPFSFRQYALDPRDARSKMNYKTGEEVFLLLHGAHPQTGLSSPAGLEQGRFRITRDSQGNRLATNGYNNGGLFRNIDPATNSKLQSLDVRARQMITTHASGPIPYDQLKSVIQAFVAKSAS
jgi:hypothetical protein